MANAMVQTNEQDTHFMKLALEQAQLAVTKGQTPFGAVVVDKDGNLIGKGHNTVRANLDPTAHGEITALRDALKALGALDKLEGSTLYSSCEPCLLCSFTLTQMKIGRVVFAARGSDVPTYKALLGADLTEAAAWVNEQADWSPIEVVGDFMRDQAVKIIHTFPWSNG